jgi:hypothetical protein
MLVFEFMFELLFTFMELFIEVSVLLVVVFEGEVVPLPVESGVVCANITALLPTNSIERKVFFISIVLKVSVTELITSCSMQLVCPLLMQTRL